MQVPLLLLLAASTAARDVHASLSTAPVPPLDSSERRERCTTLGFDVDALDCCLCSELSTFLTTSPVSKSKSKIKVFDTIGQECQECCSDFSKVLEVKGRRYANVVLALSPRRWRRYPNVAHFVEHEAAKLKRLEVREVETRLPMLQFFDSDEGGELVEEISIAHWDEKAIAEFIDNKLLPEEDEEQEGVVVVMEEEVDAVDV